MSLAPSVPSRYGDLLTGSYDCVDRIVLNAFFPLGHNPGGFRVWWRGLHGGSDDELDNTHLMRFAGRFARRVKAWANANGVPVIYCKAGQRKHLVAEEYLGTHEVGTGVFLVLAAKAPASVWEVRRSESTGVIGNIAKKTAYVNHYSFHIMDPWWGHVTIKMSGHPPFPAQIILNGHEYVAAVARAAGIGFAKEGNCFTGIADPQRLAQVADTLSQHAAIGRLGQVCDRWIYSACLCFGLDLADQARSRFAYSYSIYQAQYSRNLLFRSGGQMEEQVGVRAAVHLSFDHLDAVDVAFDGAGTVGDGEPGGDGGPVLAQSLGEAAQLADRAGLGLGGPGFEVLAVAVAQHVRELADQAAGGFEFLAAGGDLRERGPVVIGELAGRGEDPAGHLPGRRRGWWRGDGSVLAELGGEPAQGALAAAVAAFAQFLVQPFGAADSFVPALAQVGLVRAEQARAGSGGGRRSGGPRSRRWRSGARSCVPAVRCG